MKRFISIAIAPVVLLAACAEVPLRPPLSGEARLLNGFDLTTTGVPNPHQPNVFVVGKKLVIDQEPIVIEYHESPVTIAWALAAGSDNTFASNEAISVDVNDKKVSNFKCRVNGKAAKSISCTYSVNQEGTIKYTIKVKSAAGEVSLDPFINNW